MPIYEYGCASCGHQFDRLRPMSQMDDPAACPECDSDGQRMLSVFAVYSGGSNGETSAVPGGGGAMRRMRAGRLRLLDVGLSGNAHLNPDVLFASGVRRGRVLQSGQGIEKPQGRRIPWPLCICASLLPQ